MRNKNGGGKDRSMQVNEGSRREGEGESERVRRERRKKEKKERWKGRRFMREVKSVDPAAEYRCLGNLSEKSPSFDSFGNILTSLSFQDGV